LISDGPKFGNESNESITKTKVALKSHSVTQAGDTLKKVAGMHQLRLANW